MRRKRPPSEKVGMGTEEEQNETTKVVLKPDWQKETA
jgi:hypothetical protein